MSDAIGYTIISSALDGPRGSRKEAGLVLLLVPMVMVAVEEASLFKAVVAVEARRAAGPGMDKG